MKKEAIQIIRKTREDYNTIAIEFSKTRFLPSGIKLRLLKDIKKNTKVLDLGCGNGLIAMRVIKAGASYVGTDISQKLIKIAKNKFKEEIKKGWARFFVADAAKELPFEDNYFDRVFCFAVLHHIPSDELRLKLLGEVKRVLKNGGEARFIVWNLMNKWPRERFKIKEQLKNLKSRYEKGDVFVPWKAVGGKVVSRYLHAFTKKELLNLARSVGFQNIKIDFYNRVGQKTKNGEELALQIKKYKTKLTA